MDRAAFQRDLARAVPADRVAVDAPLAPLTTFRLGGPADWLITIDTETELVTVVEAAANAKVPLTVIGGGSNVIVSDRGIRGAVLRLRLTNVSQSAPNRVRAEAGVTINGLVRWTIAHGLGGVEAWAGTPGTVGGAVYGNAHYGGVNIGDLVDAVSLVALDGQRSEAAGSAMEFAYDTSRLKRTNEILIWAEFAAKSAPPEALRRTARASLAHRKQTQPLALPSAGCIFQNPDPRIDVLPAGIPASAGALIDRAGLKGVTKGGARFSPTHANFIVNEGGATGADVRALVEMARDTVKARFGITLADEVVFLGEW